MSKALVTAVTKTFGAQVLGSHAQFGDDTVIVEPSAWLPVHAFLRDDSACQMAMLIDLCAVDYPDRDPRFEVVTHLYSLSRKHRLRVKTMVGNSDGDNATLPTLISVWQAANWLERETFDMMGVVFEGHGDLRRILTYDEFEGHPLRRDYDAQKTQPLVPYREVDNIEKLLPFGKDEGMPFGRQTHNVGAKDN